MNTFEIVRSVLDVWPLWLVFGIFATLAWKLPKHKGSRVSKNPAKTLNDDVFAQFTGMPQSNGALSSFSSSSQAIDNNDAHFD
jgi:hypothetical protein